MEDNLQPWAVSILMGVYAQNRQGDVTFSFVHRALYTPYESPTLANFIAVLIQIRNK